jgi:hypothetical protein
MKHTHPHLKKHGTRFVFLFAWIISAALALTSCGGGGGSSDAGGGGGGGSGTASVALSVISTNESSIAEALNASSLLAPSEGIAPEELASAPTFTNFTMFSPGYINSGEPDYLKITMTKIRIEGDWGDTDTLWEGEKELVLDGTPVDISDIAQDFNTIHTGTATKISLTFKSTAKVKGTLTANFNLGSLTVHTKGAYAYDAVNHTGGANSYTAFTSGSAEEMDLPLSGDGDTITIEADCNTPITEDGANNLTILFDTSRVLRFYDGGNPGGSGVNPPDPGNKAYFFGHSLLSTFIAPFFGTPGRIEGYKAFYSATAGGGVYAWMTLVYDGDGNFLKGMLMGDDDNALTIAKGRVLTFEDGASAGTYDFTYDTANGSVTGFSRVSTLDCYTPLTTFVTNAGTAEQKSGEAYFQLQFVME